MDIGIREVVEGIAFVSGWVAAFTTVRIKANETSKRLDNVQNEHIDNIKKLEQVLRSENAELSNRIEKKKEVLYALRDEIHKEISEIRQAHQTYLRNDVADSKFVSKSELKLMLEKIEIQYRSLDDKLDMILESKGDV